MYTQLIIRAGDVFDALLTYANNGTPVALTGLNARVAVLSSSMTSMLLKDSATSSDVVVTQAAGQIAIHFSSTETAAFNTTVADCAGLLWYLLQNRFKLFQEHPSL